MDWSRVCAEASAGASFCRFADAELIEDAVQEVCLALVSGKPIRYPNNYGYYYAHNLARKRRPETFSDMKIETDREAGAGEGSLSWLWSSVEELCSEDEASVLRSRYIGRMTIAEMVAALGLPRSRVVALMRSGVAKLRESLNGMEE